MVKVGIFHPNLGIGGAERLVVDIAITLKQVGHDVDIYTNYYSKSHSFTDIIDNFKIHVLFSWLPDSIMGVFKVYMAMIKMLLLTIYFITFELHKYDLILVDQIGVISIPLLKMFNKKVIFYCHFPDQFLTDRKSWLKKVYRYFADFIEVYSIRYSDLILVNSHFTLNTLIDSFSSIGQMYKNDKDFIKVVYPCTNIRPEYLDAQIIIDNFTISKVKNLFVSINRYHPKKCVERALTGFFMLKNTLTDQSWQETHLIIMGGCDPDVASDTRYFNYLYKMAIDYELIDPYNPSGSRVTFLKNPNDSLKFSILQKATALIYTPDFEHFGIVPIEAMQLGVPVIASASGGPLETIIDGKTGFLVTHFGSEFVSRMLYLIDNPTKKSEMGKAASEHAQKNFSLPNMQMSMQRALSLLNFTPQKT